jgi:predicted dehydrogenase
MKKLTHFLLKGAFKVQKKLPAIAVLGTGSIGEKHIRVLKTLGAEAIAIPVRDERIAELKAQGLEAVKDLDAARKAGAQGVVIASATSRHIDDCIEASGLGFAVLCEKPLAVSASQAVKLGSVNISRVFVGYTLRFDDGFRKTFELAGELGRPHYMAAECRSYLPSWRKGRDYRQNYSVRSEEGGVLLDLSHEIDYINFFYGKPKTLSGLRKNLGYLNIAEEEIASAVMEYEEKGIGCLTVDYLSRQTSRKLTIACENGEIHYDFVNKIIDVFSEGRESSVVIERGADTMYEREDMEFLKIIDGKEREYLATPKEAVEALSVIDAWKQSSASGMRIEVEYVD